MNKAYFGSLKIDKIYLGSTLVFENEFAFKWYFIEETSSEPVVDVVPIIEKDPVADDGFALLDITDAFPPDSSFAGLIAAVLGLNDNTYYVFECQEA
jgi:hypothetical protein